MERLAKIKDPIASLNSEVAGEKRRFGGGDEFVVDKCQ